MNGRGFLVPLGRTRCWRGRLDRFAGGGERAVGVRLWVFQERAVGAGDGGGNVVGLQDALPLLGGSFGQAHRQDGLERGGGGGIGEERRGGETRIGDQILEPQGDRQPRPIRRRARGDVEPVPARAEIVADAGATPPRIGRDA